MSAYELAKANIQKPWARRWMRQNGHRWASEFYQERQNEKRHPTDDEVTRG